MAKTGRPPDTGIVRNQTVKARLDSNLFDRLNEYCFKHGMSVSEVIRMSLSEYLDKEKGLLHRQVK